MLLHTLIGYDSQPAGMQLVFYLATLAAIGAGMYLVAERQRITRTLKTA